MTKTLLSFAAMACTAMGNAIDVTTEDDDFDTPSGGTVSLREAIRDAEAMGGFVTICVPSHYEIELNSTLAPPTSGLTITVVGNDEDGNRARLVPGAALNNFAMIHVQNRSMVWRGFEMDGSGTVTPALGTAVAYTGITGIIDDCVFTGWRTTGINFRTGSGGTVRNCSFSDNRQGFIASGAGTLTLEQSVFYHHQSIPIFVSGDDTTITCRNLTVAENAGIRGMRMTGTFDSASLSFCTFVDNLGAALEVPLATRVSYSLFARNSGSDGISASLIENALSGADSNGYNLSDDSPASFDSSTDIFSNVVKVSRLGDFGGERYCCFPLNGSEAIDGGNPNYTTVIPSSDSRGFLRKHKNTLLPGSDNIIDIGAVEVNPEGTLVVTQSDATGPGTLAAALDAADGDTVHIVFNLLLLELFFNDANTLVIDESRNYNLDATGSGLNQFSAPAAAGPIFQIGSTSVGEETTVSLSGFNFRDFEPDASDDRGCIQVYGGGSLSLDQCNFEGNVARAEGVVDLEGTSSEPAFLFANECEFDGNSQISSNGFPNDGGAAIQGSNARMTVWNSTFSNNEVIALPSGSTFSSNPKGGAVLLESGALAHFRQCTFSGNKARSDGSAIFAEDSSFFETDTIVLDRCTIAENETMSGRGAVAFENRGRLLANRTLFYRNSNGGNPATAVSERDLHADVPGLVVVLVEEDNWTDASAAFSGLVASSNLGAEYLLNDLGNFGGRIPTRPIFGGTEPSGTDTIAWRYPRDAVRAIGRVGFAMPGAVQETVGVANAQLSIESVFTSGQSLLIVVVSTDESVWEIHRGDSPGSLAFEGQTHTGNGFQQTVNVGFGASLDEKHFVRFVQQDN